jgi:hypothetical protein
MCDLHGALAQRVQRDVQGGVDRAGHVRVAPLRDVRRLAEVVHVVQVAHRAREEVRHRVHVALDDDRDARAREAAVQPALHVGTEQRARALGVHEVRVQAHDLFAECVSNR